MKIRGALALAAIAFCASAAAQPYGAVAVGMSSLNVDCEGAARCDKTDTAFKLLGGYRFTPQWAGEVGYMNFGKAKASDAGVSAEIGTTALMLGAAYHADLSPDWTAVLRLGVGQVKTKISGSVAGLGSGSDDDTNAAAYFGLGFGYRLSKTTTLDFAGDFTKSKYDKNGVNESGNVRALSLGLSFAF